MFATWIDWDKWQEIIAALKKQKMRTALTAFGVFWGIFMLVIMLGFGQGYSNNVDALFGDTKNAVFMRPSNVTQFAYKGLPKGREIRFTQDDIDAIKQKIPNLQTLAGINWLRGSQYVVNKKNGGSFWVIGTHGGWAALNTNRVVEGRYINQRDEDEFRKVAVIGTRVRPILFKDQTEVIGKFIKIQGISFKVVGIYESTEPDSGDQNQSISVFLPNETLRKTFNQMDRFNQILIQPGAHQNTQELEREIKKIIYERQKIHPDDQGVLNTYNSEQEYLQNKNLVNGIIGFSWMVAIGTIIAGVIGVGNIMLIVVKERTREIGLRKALGATPTNISLMIMNESLVITLVAGYTGLVAGVAVLEVVKAVLINMGKGNGMFASPFIDIGTAFTALTVLVVIGALAALLPAIKAASVNPIVALQDE
ncbi:ABC transporter permease [Cellvibrio sp. NN19]|uniref:ABC transporter permease n=1 Tax=Cellvibrio chitinivorans TaxID=3102792 RepID=UPI002B40B30D|nr:ABC transporter permease [Cellvibrio sp. NN19]